MLRVIGFLLILVVRTGACSLILSVCCGDCRSGVRCNECGCRPDGLRPCDAVAGNEARLLDPVAINIVQHFGSEPDIRSIVDNGAVPERDDTLAVAEGIIDLMERNDNGGAVLTIDLGKNIHDIAG